MSQCYFRLVRLHCDDIRYIYPLSGFLMPNWLEIRAPCMIFDNNPSLFTEVINIHVEVYKVEKTCGGWWTLWSVLWRFDLVSGDLWTPPMKAVRELISAEQITYANYAIQCVQSMSINQTTYTTYEGLSELLYLSSVVNVLNAAHHPTHSSIIVGMHVHG